MNYLAHFYLAHQNEQMIVGNLLGEFVKGDIAKSNYPNAVKMGIIQHRSIDFFTDTHSVVKHTKRLLSPHFGKYSGVVSDMFFDYFLATNWYLYSEISLSDFAQNVYNSLNKHKVLLPEKLLPMLVSMQTHNWLVNYGTINGLAWALGGIASRRAENSGIETATNQLLENKALYEADFLVFFPELIDHCKQFFAKEG